jgi:hypothetical protein
MTQEDEDRLALWRSHDFSDAEARAWLVLMPEQRFTPYTARDWAEEGFSPAEAAQWSERFASPQIARSRRDEGIAGPWELDAHEGRDG